MPLFLHVALLLLMQLLPLPWGVGTAWAQATGPAERAAAALSQYKIDSWQSEQGLPMDTVQALLQDGHGVLWVGTGGGLVGFDGRRFAAPAESSPQELRARPVFGFFEDRDGALWVGHINGATRLHQGRVETVFGRDLTAGRRVWAFAQDGQGAVWAASENGLLRWQNGQLRRYLEADGLPTRRLRSLVFDREGTLWVATSGGGLVSFSQGRFEVRDVARGFPHNEVRHLLADPDGGIWAATAGAGLVHLRGATLRRYTVADGLPSEQLTALARDGSGALWIGTWGAGLTRFWQGRFQTMDSRSGLGDDHVWTLQLDREGSLWVGTWHGGMSRLRRRPFVVLGKPEGLSSDKVRSVLHARDGSTWVATAGGGINHLEPGGITVIGRKDGLASDEVASLFEDHDGALWAATYTDGVSRLHQGRVRSFGLAQGLPNADVRVLYRDRQGVLWAGTRAGLARLQGERFVPVREPGAPTEGITTILQDRAGTLWFGSSGSGLLRYRDGVFSALTRGQGLASNWVMALHEDRHGALWIGTNGEGLNRLRDGGLATVRAADGLWDGLTQVILEDRLGHLWFTSNRGFFGVAEAELNARADGGGALPSTRAFATADGLRSATFAGGVHGAGAVDAQGRLWLPSVKGLVIVDPQRLPDPTPVPPVTIQGVQIDGVAAPEAAALTLPPGAGTLAIRYAAASLLHAERLRFRYRMDGLEGGWVEAGPSREAHFTALPPGRYRFRVAATLDGSRWRELDVPLAVEVQPHWLQTTWVRLLLLLLALATGLALYRLRTHQLRRRHAQMQRLVAQQTEALRQANEHLAQLSFADALTGLANRRRLDEVLQSEWRRAERTQSALALVIADIDAFKAYNDSLGHLEGDRCLAAVAQVLRECASRAGDFAARFGGEEFVVLIPGADAAAATAFAERLRQACQARALPHPASPVAPVVTLSLGVAACVPASDGTAAQLLAAADAALYRAKALGRNRVVCAPGAPGA